MLILEKKPKSRISEAYRTLRTNIQFSKFDGELKTILITSSGYEDSNSSVTCNLALAFAQAGNTVLLIDCNLRKPKLHKKLNVFNEVGLSDCILEGINPFKLIIEYRENLDVLTSGTIPPNPAEIVASNRMKYLLEYMKKIYDYIIIDSPPLLSVTDAQILSTEADGTVLLITSGESDKEQCIKAKNLLEKVNGEIIGVVMSKVECKSKLKKNKRKYRSYSRQSSRSKKRKLITRNV